VTTRKDTPEKVRALAIETLQQLRNVAIRMAKDVLDQVIGAAL
jgi:hypothetical protein